MSILYSASEGYVINHELHLQYAYKHSRENDSVCNLEPHSDIFKILSPYDSGSKDCNYSPKKKLKNSAGREIRIQSSHVNNFQTEKIKNVFHSLLLKAKSEGFFKEPVPLIPTKNIQAKEKADTFYKESSKYSKSLFQGCNNLSHPVIEKVNNERYVFPSMCRFFCQDVIKLKEILVPLNVKYDLIVLDPPWWNKYIRRKKSKCTEASYQMMYNDSLKNLPIAELLSPDALVAVWCTNSDQNINALLTEVFPDWGVKYLGTWIWLKVTNSGEPICAFADPPKKQPYERIIFGCNSEKSRCYNVPEDEKIIISVPSAIHSHKPPLSDVLSSYLPPEPNCLELFARYLLPNWTSWGNEVLKLQHISLFKENPSEKTTSAVT
ncbi:Uncharacterized protein GBIM_11711 [Gryllus bimaculatus]|nr:Uncharacterized protein GBIM_11711 [Gryllus bimaculatus]